ncbi:MAG: M14 family zinc carboxypeptidase, partial [candidate division KSB1 bacterium]|nr:M14 family zinc carboxypeptidase [candidate division KSB1 bacterium]
MKRRLNLVKLSLILMLAFLLSNSLCQNGNPGDPNAGLYHTYSELEAELQDLAKNHPAIAQLSSLGRSHEGRELWALNISDQVDNDESEPAIILLGAHHAREWISVEVPLLIARFLIEQYGVDTTVTRLVDQVEIWVVPMVNPDGHQHSVTTDRLWRKNRR